MEGERRFAFIPVALPHCISFSLPPSLSLSPSLSPLLSFRPPSSVSRTLDPLLSVPFSHITSVPPVVQLGITSVAVIPSYCSVADILRTVLFLCCHSKYIGLFRGKLTAKHSVLVVFFGKMGRCRQSVVKGWMSGAEESCLRCSVTCRFKRPIDP